MTRKSIYQLMEFAISDLDGVRRQIRGAGTGDVIYVMFDSDGLGCWTSMKRLADSKSDTYHHNQDRGMAFACRDGQFIVIAVHRDRVALMGYRDAGDVVLIAFDAAKPCFELRIPIETAGNVATAL